MLRRIIAILTFVAAMLLPHIANGQIVPIENEVTIDADSARRALDKRPYFGLYKDNYFIFGTSVGPKANRENTNLKFQISISQRLTKTVLPWNTYLYLFYTQKCIWNVVQKSMPMRDLNFNPGIGLRKPLFSNGRYIGNATLILEHESNGRDSVNSRSWNRLALSANIMLDPRIIIHGKIWIPYVDGGENRDLLRYAGIMQGGFSYTTNDHKWIFSCLLTKRYKWKMSFNTTLELSFRPWKRTNQYFFMQYYNGYSEYLLDYNQFRSELRVGFVIKPTLFSDF